METTRLIDPAFWGSTEPVAPGRELPAGVVDPDGLVWFQTSGSTGSPSWIGHTREALLLSAAMVNQHLQVQAEDVWGAALPIHHVGGFGVVARAFEAGAVLESFRDSWEPLGFRDWLSQKSVSHLSLVPTQVHDLVAAGLRAPDFLKTVVVGGGELSSRLGQQARDLGWPVLSSYGMTEAGSQIATLPLSALGEDYQSMPLPILPHWEVEVGEDDCLKLRGASLFHARLIFRDGWRFERRVGDEFVTEDRGQVEQGILHLDGRADRQVKVLGELVDLDAVQQALGVPDVVLVAVRDDRREHRLVLVHTGDFVDQSIADYQSSVKGPWRIMATHQVDAFPRSDLGKVRMAELQGLVGESKMRLL